MKACPDLDALVTLEEALEWDAERAVHHLVSCEFCLAELRRVERLHEVLDESLDLSHGFTGRVLASLPSARSHPNGEKRTQQSRAWVLSAAIFGLASATALLVLSSAIIAAPSAGDVGPEVLGFAALAGFVALKLVPRTTC